MQNESKAWEDQISARSAHTYVRDFTKLVCGLTRGSLLMRLSVLQTLTVHLVQMINKHRKLIKSGEWILWIPEVNNPAAKWRFDQEMAWINVWFLPRIRRVVLSSFDLHLVRQREKWWCVILYWTGFEREIGHTWRKDRLSSPKVVTQLLVILSCISCLRAATF